MYKGLLVAALVLASGSANAYTDEELRASFGRARFVVVEKEQAVACHGDAQLIAQFAEAESLGLRMPVYGECIRLHKGVKFEIYFSPTVINGVRIQSIVGNKLPPPFGDPNYFIKADDVIPYHATFAEYKENREFLSNPPKSVVSICRQNSQGNAECRPAE